jgi:DNA repair exonuclease SbcCD nuclease subunit
VKEAALAQRTALLYQNRSTFVLCRTKQAALELYVIEGDHDSASAVPEQRYSILPDGIEA